uniref:Carnitine O-palmitoyltransferase 2 n=1 Tax=Hirondellea gigas TaxID=1518452 RepID=A0A2P2I894_9CRUS
MGTLRLPHQIYRSSTGGLSRLCSSSDSADHGRRAISNWASDEYQFLHKSYAPTMHFQKSLLRLPVPELDKTCARYLLSQKALLDDADYKETEKLVEDFRVNAGPPLQEKLKTQDKNNKHTNYISKPWFDMYLSDRAPVVLNYNPFLAFLPPEPGMANPVMRATNLLVSSARFMRTLRNNILEPEVFHLNPAKSDTDFFRKLIRWTPQMFASFPAYAMKAFPLDMSQFGNLLNSTRIPGIGKDSLSCDDTAKHILVMKDGNFYVFDILDQNGCVHPPSHMHACMTHIAADTTPRPSHPIGYLTSENRDTWAKVRHELESLGNGEALRMIDHAAFNIVFDDSVLADDHEKSYRTFLYGDAGNRWFDKSFSVIFAKDGITALNFEHAWGDGVAIMRYFNEIANDEKHNFITPESVPAAIDASQYVRRLELKLSSSVESAVSAAKQQYEAATGALAVHVLESDLLGKQTCKEHKVSPDAIMQLGFQVAYRMLYGGVAATYESCSTSAFKHGRTETVRPATLQTKAFSDAVCGTSVQASAGDLKRMIMECSAVHGELTKNAAMGQGFDRHLYGLRKMSEADGVAAAPALYQDPAYARINHNVLSTSTLPSNLISFGGFAPVVRDGFGIGYQIKGDKLGLVVSSYPPHRDGAGFVECARKAYTLIRDALASK